MGLVWCSTSGIPLARIRTSRWSTVRDFRVCHWDQWQDHVGFSVSPLNFVFSFLQHCCLQRRPQDHNISCRLDPGLPINLHWNITVHMNLDMTPLDNPYSCSQTTLNLPEVHHPLHSNHLQHTIPVVWFGEILILFRSPCICSRAPTHNVENDDALYGRQLYVLSVHFQLNFFV